MRQSDSTSLSLDCNSGVIILSVIATFYSALSVVLLVCIIWCSGCCKRKGKFQVKPLSHKDSYRSPKNSVSYPEIERHEMTSFPPLHGSTRLPPLRESEVLGAVGISIVYKNSPGAPRKELARVPSDKLPGAYPTWSGGDSFLHKQMVLSHQVNSELKDRLNSNIDSDKGSLSLPKRSNQNDDHSCRGDDSQSTGTESNDYSENMFVNSHSISHAVDGCQHDRESSNIVERKNEAIVKRRRAERTDSTKPLITGDSESNDFSQIFSSESSMSCPPTPPVVVLTKRASSRKRKSRTDSMKQLVEYMDGTKSLPRMTHLPPLDDNCIQINISPRHLPPITHTDATPITHTDATPTTHTDTAPQEPPATNDTRQLLSSERPRPKCQNVTSTDLDSTDSGLPTLSLNVYGELGLDDQFTFSKC